MDELQHLRQAHQHRTAARVGGAMMCTGGTLAVVLSAIGPGFANGRIAVPLTLAGVAVAIGVFGMLAPHRFPAALLAACGLLATSLTALSSVMTRTTTDGSEMLYLWTVLYCAYFLPYRQALLNTAFISVVYPAVVCFVLGADGVVPAVYVVGTCAVTLVIVAKLRRRLDALLGAAAREARTDKLTGLPNRRHWDERLATHLAGRCSDSLPLAVLAIDVDHFKRLNDTLGHAAGDAALTNLGQILRDHIPAGGSLARIGGEEFAIALADCTPDEALRHAERIRSAVQRSAQHWPAPITVSIGVALLPAHSSTGVELTAAADTALYAAKAAGRNTVRMYHPNHPSHGQAAAPPPLPDASISLEHV